MENISPRSTQQECATIQRPSRFPEIVESSADPLHNAPLYTDATLDTVREYLMTLAEDQVLQAMLQRTLCTVQGLEEALREEERRSRALQFERTMLENLIQDKIDEERRIRALPDGARRVAATAEKVAQAAGRFAVPFVHAALESLNNFTNLSVKPNLRHSLPPSRAAEAHVSYRNAKTRMEASKVTGSRSNQAHRHTSKSSRVQFHNQTSPTKHIPAQAKCQSNALPLLSADKSAAPIYDPVTTLPSTFYAAQSTRVAPITNQQMIADTYADVLERAEELPTSSTTTITTVSSFEQSPTPLSSSSVSPEDSSPPQAAQADVMMIMDVTFTDSQEFHALCNGDPLRRLQVTAAESIQEAVDAWTRPVPLDSALKARLVARLEKEEENASSFPMTTRFIPALSDQIINVTDVCQ